MPKDATKRKVTRARKPTRTLRERRVIYTAEQIFANAVSLQMNSDVTLMKYHIEVSLQAAAQFWETVDPVTPRTKKGK